MMLTLGSMGYNAHILSQIGYVNVVFHWWNSAMPNYYASMLLLHNPRDHHVRTKKGFSLIKHFQKINEESSNSAYVAEVRNLLG